jgi:histidinol-phosphate aminotransferase
MSDPLKLARPEILALKAYEHAAWDPSLERLHANEAPWAPLPEGEAAGLNRYPEPQPRRLVERIAALYGVAPDRVLLGRGSDEAIDLLMRGFCAAGRDAIVVCPPTFGMYAVAARIQGAAVIEVPLRRDQGFALDVPGVIAALDGGTKLVFLCTPNNPTGNLLADDALRAVLDAASGRALVVVDEAYMEFAAREGYSAWIDRYPHLVVLRTLSKAHGLAGARLGTLIALPPVVTLLRKVIPPYALAQPAVDAVLRALEPAALAVTRERVAGIVAERERVAAALPRGRGVRRIWPGAGNFLLVEFDDAGAALAAIAGVGLLVRDFRGKAGLGDALRITVGSPEQNDRLLRSLGA